MYRLIFIVPLLFCGCKSSYQYTHHVKAMYEAPYDKQVIITYPFLEKPDAAKVLGITLMSIYFSHLNVDFTKYDSINVTSVNKNNMWKVKIIRIEEVDNISQPAHYYCYIRKKDGALLYATREIGEWIGSTDIEEGYFKSR